MQRGMLGNRRQRPGRIRAQKHWCSVTYLNDSSRQRSVHRWERFTREQIKKTCIKRFWKLVRRFDFHNEIHCQTLILSEVLHKSHVTRVDSDWFILFNVPTPSAFVFLTGNKSNTESLSLSSISHTALKDQTEDAKNRIWFLWNHLQYPCDPISLNSLK